MKYLGKDGFSVYNNYPKVDKCDECQKEGTRFNITIYGRLCDGCYAAIKKEKGREKKG